MHTLRLASRLHVPQGDLEPLVRRALHRIDAVHTVLDVPEMPVVYTNDPQRFGAYKPEQEDTPRCFELSRSGPHPELTLTHEVGHFLDHALGDFDVYLSREPVSVFSELKQALEGSRAISELRFAVKTNTGLALTERLQLQYWLDEREQWARAYAQFIAFQSGERQAEQQLERSRDLGLDKPAVFRNVQWDRDDFAPVASAIEAAFRQLVLQLEM